MSFLSISDSQFAQTDWIWDFIFTDDTTGDAIDFTDASITVNIRDYEGCLKVSCSVGSGITLLDTGTIELHVTANQTNFCAGTYLISGTYTLNGVTLPLFSGTISVERS